MNKITKVLAGLLLVAALLMSAIPLFSPDITDQRLNLLLEKGFPIWLYEDDGINQGGRIPVPARIKFLFVNDQSGTSAEDNRLTFVISREEEPKGLFRDGTRIIVHVSDENIRPPRQ